jgi:hypothetical protein
MSQKGPKNPLFSAAVLKLSFLMNRDEQSEGFKFVYEGTLRDLGLTDDDVEAYLKDHREEVVAAVQGRLSQYRKN